MHHRLHLLITALLVLAGAHAGWCAGEVNKSLAVVVDPETALGVDLMPGEDAAAVAGGFRSKGFKVATTPDGGCMAVTKPRKVDEASLKNRDTLRSILAAGIAERVTPEQPDYAHVQMSRAELTPDQWDAAFTIARNAGFVDDKGNIDPRFKNAQLTVTVKTEWSLHVTTPVGDKVICHKLSSPTAPPTPAAVEAEPLAGSALWYAWPYSASRAIDAKISLKAGDYSLKDLTDEIAKAAGVTVKLQTNTDKPRWVWVSAVDTPVMQLLWAIEAATRLKVTLDQAQKPVVVTISDTTEMQHSEHSVLQSIPGVGYYPEFSPVIAAKLANMHKGICEGAGELSIGWRFTDLPAVYQKKIKKAWDEGKGSFMDYNGPFDPEKANAVWIGTVTVGLEVYDPKAGGGGTEIYLPAL